MKFIVSSSQLFRQLQILGGVINSNNTLPILDNFLFELTDNQLRISASDLETTMSTSIEVEADEKGAIAVPARLLLDILKTFPEVPDITGQVLVNPAVRHIDGAWQPFSKSRLSPGFGHQIIEPATHVDKC